MRPGVAANADSVRRLMDGMRAGREQMLKIERDEDREMGGYLNPVQRARYQQLRERFMQRVNEMRAERRERREMGAPPPRVRSEEHTSELQSLAYLVCRLLLEKKKNRNRRTADTRIDRA